jgi:hypothetical protein
MSSESNSSARSRRAPLHPGIRIANQPLPSRFWLGESAARFILTVASIVSVTMLGCAVGPDFKRPNAPTSAYPAPPGAVGPQSIAYGGDVTADWYTLFHSESLNSLVQEALRTSPDLEGARHNLLAAQYELQAVAGTEDAIFTVDVGTPTVWAARYLKLNGKRRLIGSFVHGSMANAMPQAIGAQAVYPRRQVIALCGDGGFSMLMGDLLTLPQQKLPLKVVIFNNGTLGFVELEMKVAGYLETGVELVNPDFAAMARGAGLFARRVEDPGELADAAREVLAHPGPAVLDVVTNRQELALPPKVDLKEATGFGLWVAKAVLNGKGTEVLDLARTNLFR